MRRPSATCLDGARTGIALIAAGLLGLVGCSSTPPAETSTADEDDAIADSPPTLALPDVLDVPPGRYDDAFDAMVTAARELGLVAAVRDRREGTIESEPRIGSSLIEFWHPDNRTIETAVENTVNFQRRRLRVEFVPAELSGPIAPAPIDRLAGPDLLGTSSSRIPDLTTYEGPIEMRVWVFLERAHTPGLRRGFWTLSVRSRWTTLDQQPIAPEDGLADTSEWTPVARDVALEQHLVALVREAIERPRPE